MRQFCDKATSQKKQEMQMTRQNPNLIRHMEHHLNEMVPEATVNRTTRQHQHLLNLKHQNTQHISNGIEDIRHLPRENLVTIRLGRRFSIATVRIRIGCYCDRYRSFDKLASNCNSSERTRTRGRKKLVWQSGIKNLLADRRSKKVRLFTTDPQAK